MDVEEDLAAEEGGVLDEEGDTPDEEAEFDGTLDEQTDITSWLGDSLFDPQWSWFQPDAQGSIPVPPTQSFSELLNWTGVAAPIPAAPAGLGCGSISWDSAFVSD